MIEYHKAFDLLRGYLEQRGIYLAKGNFDAYMHEDKTVVYNFRLRNKENMIFSILHEIGHHLAFMNRKTYENKFPVLFKHRFNNAKTNKRTNRYRMEVILEEYDAWHRGERLAKKLNIDIDADKYYTYASRQVKTYYDGVV